MIAPSTAALGIAAFTLWQFAGPARAQEATNTPAATQPSVGRWYLREKVQYILLRDDPSPEGRDIEKVSASTTLTYGLTRNVSASVELPLVLEFIDRAGRDGADTEFGAGDLSLSFKWRPFQKDLNPLDSLRLAFFAGVEAPTGAGDLGSHSWDPFAGAVFTGILGRHGINQAISYKFNTGGDAFSASPGDGPADALRYDTAYLFRIKPAEYEAQTTAATYLTLEANGLYETNGDNEILLGVGVLYEARTFAIEAAVGLPVVQEVEKRPETALMLTLGFRMLF